MDISTIIVILSVHLVVGGGLLLLIGRRTPQGDGLAWFGVGCIVNGSCLFARLKVGARDVGPDSAMLDAGLLLAIFFFHGGLRLFTGRSAPRVRWLVALVAGYVPIALLAMAAFGPPGRHALLNILLGGGQVAFGIVAVRSLRDAEAALRPPMLAFGAMIGLLGALTLLRGAVAGTIGVEPIFHGPLAQAYAYYGSLVGVLFGPLVLWMAFMRLNGKLAEMATRDPLTGLLNRHGLADALRLHFGPRQPRPVTVLQIDVDHFKRINDTHGHDAGDAVLRVVGETLARSVRAGDFAARTGGEEFLIGCVGAQAGVAAVLAERLRDAVAALRVEAGTAMLHCTISVGVSAPANRLDDWACALREADDALYAAKDAGRDRVLLSAFATLDEGDASDTDDATFAPPRAPAARAVDPALSATVGS